VIAQDFCNSTGDHEQRQDSSNGDVQRVGMRKERGFCSLLPITWRRGSPLFKREHFASMSSQTLAFRVPVSLPFLQGTSQLLI